MSKKYKLIKAYPGSPKLGAITSSLIFNYCANYPEFWEEVIEQDYEILSFKLPNTKSLMVGKTKQGWYTGVNEVGYNDWRNEEWLLKNNYTIESVKRLSDGTVFTVGDKVIFLSHTTVLEHICLNKQKQVCFKIKGCYAVLENVFSNNDFKHAPKPLFTTEDGIDIYLMKKYWCVYPDFSYENFSANIGSGKEKSYKYFSTEAAAENYIMFNKPCLSVQEICPIIGEANYTAYIDLNTLTKKLINLVESKS
jgi:hypothetical protein